MNTGNKYEILPWSKKLRLVGKKYIDKNGKIRLWDGKILKCQHNKRVGRCYDCGNKKKSIIPFEKSFAFYKGKTKKGIPIIDCWDTIANQNTSPRNIYMGTHKKYSFKCPDCNECFKMRPLVHKRRGTFCKQCKKKDPLYQYKKPKTFEESFASYDGATPSGKKKVECWIINQDGITPRDVCLYGKYSGKFKCPECNHIFNTKLYNIVYNTWCPYCSGNKHCNNNDCSFCYKKSFQYIIDTNPDIQKNMLIIYPQKQTARQLTHSTKKKVTCICKTCSTKSLKTIAKITSGRSCSICKNKTEKKLLEWLNNQKINLNIKSIQTQYRPSWCGTTYTLINSKNKIVQQVSKFPFDYLIEFNDSKQVIIELDGRQHYTDNNFFQKRRSKRKKYFSRSLPSSLHQQLRDRYKEIQAKKHGLYVIRIIQENVWENKNNWVDILTNKLKTLYLNIL